jgi:hypothetical protein
MKNLRLILPVITLVTLVASTSLRAGPGAEYFSRVDSVSKSAVAARNNTAQAPTSKCKVTEVILVTTGPHGTPIRQVVSSNMDCSSCNDSTMACCTGTAKS